MTGQTGFQIQEVMFGQPIIDREGRQSIATADHIQLTLVCDGAILASGLLSPEQGIVLAKAIQSSARTLINAEVDDDGRPTSFSHRLRRLTGRS